MAGINRNTPNPPGGTFDRDANGDLNGRVTDRARGAFNQRRQATDVYRRTDAAARPRRDGLHLEAVRPLRADDRPSRGRRSIRAAGRARAGELLHRVSYEANGQVLDSMIAGGIATGFGDEWIRFGATSEHTVDGSFSERTMAMSAPYPGVTPPYKGNVTETQDELNAWIERVHRAGIQMNCHANGDVAIDMVLTAVERAQKLFPRPDSRPKITHCTLINDDLVRRMKATGAVPAAVHDLRVLQHRQVPFLRRGYDEAIDGVSNVSRRRDSRGGGIGLQPGSVRSAHGHSGDGDAQGMGRGNVGRESADQRGRSAEGQHAERRVHVARGSDQGLDHAGKLADFVILADDLHTVDPEKIKDIQIVRTVVGGTTVYQA